MVLDLLNRITILRLNNVQFNNRIAYLVNSLSILLLLISLAYYATHNWFKVKRIIIEGNMKHVTPVQLTYIANNKLHGTFFTLNIEELKEQFETLPWVKKVVLKREFPHTIIVHVDEYNAVARIGDEDLLADDGEVFDGADDNVNLPTLYVSSDKAEEAYGKYKEIESVIIKHNDRIVNLWMSDPRIITVATESNLKITFCDQDLSLKLNHLDVYWDRIHGVNPGVTSMNFCYKNAVAINATR